MASLSQLSGIPSSQSNSRTQSTPSKAQSSAFFRKIDQIKTQLLRPSLTSYFQCTIDPPGALLKDWLSSRGVNYDSTTKELINLSCSDASLPGSSLMTNEITDDHTGVTERHAYRRQYDDRADFTFYVDGTSYNVILFFETWLSYITDEQKNAENNIKSKNFVYRVNYPDLYRTQGLCIYKFEKDLEGSVLKYQFYDAYPISISSMPVSYDSVSLLKCTVSFTYTRYTIDKQGQSITQDVSREPIPLAELTPTEPVTPTPLTPPPTQNPPISFNQLTNLNFINSTFSENNKFNFETSSINNNYYRTDLEGFEYPTGVGGASGQFASCYSGGQAAFNAQAALNTQTSSSTTGGASGSSNSSVGGSGIPGIPAVPTQQPVPASTSNVQPAPISTGGASATSLSTLLGSTYGTYGFNQTGSKSNFFNGNGLGSFNYNSSVRTPIALAGGGSVGLEPTDGEPRKDPLWEIDDPRAPLRNEPLF